MPLATPSSAFVLVASLFAGRFANPADFAATNHTAMEYQRRQPQRQRSKRLSLEELVAKFKRERNKDYTQRYGTVSQITRMRNEASRRAALELLEDETHVSIRNQLLRHASKLPGLEKIMMKELETSTFSSNAALAAGYLLEHGKQGRRHLIKAFETASGKTKMAQRQAILIALAQSKQVDDNAAFTSLCKSAEDQLLHPVLSQLRNRKGEHVEALRRRALESSYDPFRGLAMAQLCARGDAEAIALARKYADDPNRPLTINYQLMDALMARPEAQDLPRIARVLGDPRSRLSRSIFDRHLKTLEKKRFVKPWAVDEGAKHKELAVREFAVQLLVAFGGQDVRDALLQIAQSKEPGLRRRAIFALAKKKDERVIPVLEKAYSKGGVDHKIDALEGLALIRGGDPAFQKRLLHLASSGPVPLRLMALDIGTRHQVRALLDYLPRLLKHKDWRLRAGGIHLAREVRAKESIPLLIQVLKKEKGRLAEDCRRALASLTRLYYHQGKDWERWWKRDGKTFVLPPPEKKKKAPRRRAGGQVNRSTSASFYGIPVLSDRVVYCVDVSGSMSATTGTGISRLKVAQEALIQALKTSPKQSLVNVVFFESGVHPYENKSVSLKRKRNLQALFKFTRRQKPRGGTNIHGALVKAMEDARVDTIFLLSDGSPSAGEITNPEELVADIVRRNRSRRIVFHCISIGADSQMLRKLAEATGGRYSQQ